MFRRFSEFLLIALGISSLHAQTPTFRSGVDIVRIDAVVVDAKGMPIRGLKASDFTVLEDGKPREIVGFETVDVPIERVTEPGEAAWVRSAPQDVVTNKLEDRRLFMIVIDDVVMPFDLRAVARAKAIARDVVSRLGANDQAAVVFSMMSKKSQSFTSDRALLEAAISATSVGRMDPIASQDASVWTLGNAAAVLKSAPQARKALVFISPGIGRKVEELGPVMSGGPNGGSGSDRPISGELNTLFEAGVSGHVSVYAFDVNDFGHVGPDGIPGNINSRPRDYLRTVANNTGGRATIANEDPVQGVLQMFRENSTYYLIGFTSASSTPGRHRVEIRTTHPGAKVLSRKAFEIMAPLKPNEKRAPPLSSAMAGLMPVDSLPMRTAVTVVPGPTTKESIVAIVLGINQPAESVDGTPEKMTAQIDAYQAAGKFIRATKLDAQLALKPGASGRAQYDLLGKLSLPPGRYQLRIGAHSARLNLRGSVFVHVDVPDFSRNGVTLAPLVLSTSPAPAAAPADAFDGLLPVAPTSHRVFVASDRVSILSRTVQGGNGPLLPVTLDATIVDSKNRQAFATREKLAVATDPLSRATDYSFDLPIPTLGAGDYLLTVKATAGNKTSEKTVRFSRR